MQKPYLIALATIGMSLPCMAAAQGTASVVEILQRDGAISFINIREARAQQFDLLDKDKSGGLSAEEASGALSVAGGQRPGGAGMAGRRQQGGAMAGGTMSDDDRAKRRKAMRDRMQQGGGRQDGMRRGGGGRGAMAQGDGNPFERMQFMAADGDFNGVLTKAEFVEAPLPTLVGMDKDMDGRLTVEEIQAAPRRGGGGMQGE